MNPPPESQPDPQLSPSAQDLASPPSAPIPHDPVVQRRRGVSLVWIVPIVAAVVGLSLLVRAWRSEGPEITISFQAATGLEAGKTPVKYKDVTVGSVRSIALSEDRSHVIATVALVKSAASLAREDTRFWVVRPRIGIGGVSGVDTLLSGAYIGVDTGSSEETQRSFTGLEAPPSVINGMAGKTFAIHASDLGSLDIGSPVYFRRVQVGRVASYQLDADGRGVGVQIFVDAPYDRFVTANTRFWNASGMDVSLGADGLKLNTQSLATIIAGGIAFGTPAGDAGEAGATRATYVLAADQQTAMAQPDGPSEFVRFRFEQSLRGLSVGAPVEFLGINIGHVTSIALDYEPLQKRFPVIVNAEVYPYRLGGMLKHLPVQEGDSEERSAQFVRTMVERGLRAEARTGNLLTGQRYVSLEFLPDAPKVAFDPNQHPRVIPTVNGKFDQIPEQVVRILSKLEQLPLESISRNLDTSLAELSVTLGTVNKTFDKVNAQILPQAQQTLQQVQQSVGAAGDALAEDSPLQQNLGQTLQELQRSARSMRALTDLLGRNPESLLRGRPADAPAAPRSGAPRAPAASEAVR